MARVTVVGAGVVGLTCAVRLLESGHRVDVLARDLPLETTSAVAAALWYPYLAFPRERVLGWSAASYAAFAGLAEVMGTGVTMRAGTDVFGSPQEEPWWRSAVPSLDKVAPPSGYADAWTFLAPVVEMPLYLEWLAGRVEELGGTITRLNLSALPSGPDVVVNASALGSRLLAEDPTVTPVRGQVVLVEQVGLERWWLQSTDPATYVIPRSHDIVVGGTEEPGDWSRTPSPVDRGGDPGPGAGLVPELAGRGRPPAPRRPPPRPAVGPRRAGRRRRALLRPRRRRRDLELGHRRRGRGPRRPTRVEVAQQPSRNRA